MYGALFFIYDHCALAYCNMNVNDNPCANFACSLFCPQIVLGRIASAIHDKDRSQDGKLKMKGWTEPDKVCCGTCWAFTGISAGIAWAFPAIGAGAVAGYASYALEGVGTFYVNGELDNFREDQDDNGRTLRKCISFLFPFCQMCSLLGEINNGKFTRDIDDFDNDSDSLMNSMYETPVIIKMPKSFT